MKVVTYSHARNALKALLDDVVRDADVAIIRGSNETHNERPDGRTDHPDASSRL